MAEASAVVGEWHACFGVHTVCVWYGVVWCGVVCPHHTDYCWRLRVHLLLLCLPAYQGGGVESIGCALGT